MARILRGRDVGWNSSSPAHPMALARAACRRRLIYMRLFGSALLSSAKSLFAHAKPELKPIDQGSRLGMREGNSPAISRADRLPSTVGGMTRLAYARAKTAGIALDPLLRTAGLTPHQIEDPRIRHQGARSNQVLKSCRRRSGGRPSWISPGSDRRSSPTGTAVLRPRFLGNTHRRIAQSGAVQFHRQRGNFAKMH